jgi:uncharacterized repeat protein (TIGR03803 family)
VIRYNFGGGDDVKGYQPNGGLTIDSKGNLYGTLYAGGPGGFGLDGTMFELTPTAATEWSFQVLHGFGAYEGDGIHPYAGLTPDIDGNLYGTTVAGGDAGAGAVFQWSAASGYYLTHSFDLNGADGGKPYAGLIHDAAGNLYGTTQYGGAHSTSGTGTVGGTVYEIVTPKNAQAPKFTVAGGTYSAEQTVEITDATPGAVIYYTTNGASPIASPTRYTGAITVSKTETIKAIAVAQGYNNSAVTTASYTIE